MRKNPHLALIDVYLRISHITTNLQVNHAWAKVEVVSIGCYIISMPHWGFAGSV